MYMSVSVNEYFKCRIIFLSGIMACQKEKGNNIQKHGDRHERFKQNLKAFNVITSRAVDKLNALTVSHSIRYLIVTSAHLSDDSLLF